MEVAGSILKSFLSTPYARTEVIFAKLQRKMDTVLDRKS